MPARTVNSDDDSAIAGMPPFPDRRIAQAAARGECDMRTTRGRARQHSRTRLRLLACPVARDPARRCGPGTSAGSIRPMRRQPLTSSHVLAGATSHSRPRSAKRPAWRRTTLPAVEPQPRTRPVQHHGRLSPPPLPEVLAHIQQHVRQRPPHLRRRPLHHVVEAVRQHPPRALEHLFTQRAKRAPRLFMPFARQTLPCASTKKCAWSSWIE